MAEEQGEPSNIDRLLKHLDSGSLAENLVSARRDGADPLDAMKAVLATRLEIARERLDGSAD